MFCTVLYKLSEKCTPLSTQTKMTQQLTLQDTDGQPTDPPNKVIQPADLQTATLENTCCVESDSTYFEDPIPSSKCMKITKQLIPFALKLQTCEEIEFQDTKVQDDITAEYMPGTPIDEKEDLELPGTPKGNNWHRGGWKLPCSVW